MLLLSVLLPAAVLPAIFAVYASNSDRRSIQQELVAEADGLASDLGRELEIAKGALFALSASPSIPAGDFDLFEKQMARALRPDGAAIFLLDRAGEIKASLAESLDRVLDQAGNQRQIDQVFATGQPHVSDLRLTADGQRIVICVDVPVIVAGRVAYDLRMSFPPTVLAAALRRQNLPMGQVASILDGGGFIIARSDGGANLEGQPTANEFRFQPGRGAYQAASPNGETVLAAAAAVPATGWSVVVATDLGALEANLMRTLAGIAAAAAAILLLGLPISAYHARRIARPFQSLAVAAQALGRGALPPPTPSGVREATQTAQALAEAAAALRLREQERDQAEAARQAGEARLARLLAATPAGIIEIGPDGAVAYANPAAERILGEPPAGLVGRRLADPAAKPYGVRRAPQGPLPATWALAGKPITDLRHETVDASGRRLVLLMNVAPVHGPQGRVVGALAAFQDITARDEQAQLLSESEARFRHLADSVPALIWMNNAKGAVVFANMHFDHVFNRPAGALLGDKWAELVAPQDRLPFRAAFHQAFKSRRTFEWTVRVIDRDGKTRWMRCESVPRLNDDGDFLGYTGCAVDVTEARLAAGELEQRVAARTAELKQAISALHAEALERAQAEAQLRQSQKMEAVGQLTGGIAHDFNNMLQAIGGNLEMASRRAEKSRVPEAIQFLGNAQKTVERAAALTHRLLAFARRQALQPRAVDPNALIESMADLIARTAGPAVAARLRLCADPWTVFCDPNQLENVLLNLAINARDAMPDGGELTTRTANVVLAEADLAGQENARPGEYVEIAVSDTGKGMDEDTRAHAFEPFFTTKPVGQGTGLGLSQLYGFIQQSGGVVQLESAPAAGTTMRLCLPRHRPGADPQA